MAPMLSQAWTVGAPPITCQSFIKKDDSAHHSILPPLPGVGAEVLQRILGQSCPTLTGHAKLSQLLRFLRE